MSFGTFFDAPVNLLAMHWDFPGRLDSELYLDAIQPHDPDYDVVTDHDLFAISACENEHVFILGVTCG
jgi:hypothetical protein